MILVALIKIKIDHLILKVTARSMVWGIIYVSVLQTLKITDRRKLLNLHK